LHNGTKIKEKNPFEYFLEYLKGVSAISVRNGTNRSSQGILCPILAEDGFVSNHNTYNAS